MGLDQALEELVVDRLVRAPLGVEDQDGVVPVGGLVDAAEDLAVGHLQPQAALEPGDVFARAASKEGEHDPVGRGQPFLRVHGLPGLGVEDQAWLYLLADGYEDLARKAREEGGEDGVELGVVELLGGAAHVGRVSVGPAGVRESASRRRVDPPQEAAGPVVVLERAHEVPCVLLREVQRYASEARCASVLAEAHQTNSAATDRSGAAGSAARPENRVEKRPASSASATAPLRVPDRVTGAPILSSSWALSRIS